MGRVHAAELGFVLAGLAASWESVVNNRRVGSSLLRSSDHRVDVSLGAACLSCCCGKRLQEMK